MTSTTRRRGLDVVFIFIPDERMHVAVEYGASTEIGKLDRNDKPDNTRTRSLDQLGAGFCRASCRKQIIREQNTITRRNGALPHFKAVHAIFKAVVDRNGFSGQLSFLA